MRIEKRTIPVPHLLCFDVFTEDELKDIWNEARFLIHERRLMPPKFTGSMRNEDGIPLKQNKGVWMSEIYKDSSASDICFYTHRAFLNDAVADALANGDEIHHWYRMTNSADTLLSYYEGGNKYEYHTDASLYTICVYLFHEPKQWQGGELCLRGNGQEAVYSVSNNMAVLFPSSTKHAVRPVIMEPQPRVAGDSPRNGRICLTTFVKIV